MPYWRFTMVIHGAVRCASWFGSASMIRMPNAFFGIDLLDRQWQDSWSATHTTRAGEGSSAFDGRNVNH
jgi:hypothetical protein